ncbi:MAG: ABC transporter permease [Chitinophagales bacterium]|nr:ABC transporter permease [Chitinophagales bacterium]MDW8418506.1 ABC transporter permease [Chitinophagales bacterium]
MRKTGIIIAREYITRVTRPVFWIATLLAPLGFLLLIVASVIISSYDNESTHVALADESGLFDDYFKQYGLADAADGSVHFHVLERERIPEVETLLKSNGDNKKYQAIIRIPPNYRLENPENPVISCQYAERIGLDKKQFITDRISEMVKRRRMLASNISEEQQAMLNREVEVVFESLMDKNERKGYDAAAAIVGLLMAMAIYISIFFYGTMIMKGVQEEKTNRIIEVLISSVKPFQLMIGKIIGVGAVGLTQFVLWIVLIFLINLMVAPLLGVTIANNSSMASGAGGDVDTDAAEILLRNLALLPYGQIIVLFPLYFLGGFFLYGSLFAALGAAMGEDGDQQSLMIPISLPIIISVFIAMNVMKNPDSSLGFWGSLIPFTSPVVMGALLPFRLPWWHIALSLALLIGGFLLTTYIAARVYRTAILMYGKKISFKELMRWAVAGR